MGIHVAVEVRFSDFGDKPLLRLDAMQELATSHIVVDTRGPPEGRFTFTSHEPGASCIRLSPFFPVEAPPSNANSLERNEQCRRSQHLFTLQYYWRLAFE